MRMILLTIAAVLMLMLTGCGSALDIQGSGKDVTIYNAEGQPLARYRSNGGDSEVKSLSFTIDPNTKKVELKLEGFSWEDRVADPQAIATILKLEVERETAKLGAAVVSGLLRVPPPTSSGNDNLAVLLQALVELREQVEQKTEVASTQPDDT